jgi:hypothetical protein
MKQRPNIRFLLILKEFLLHIKITFSFEILMPLKFNAILNTVVVKDVDDVEMVH